MTDSAIEVQDLSRVFGKRLVLKNINLSVRRGQVFGYLGPNGAGKTTTLRIMLGLIRPTAGRVLVLGHDVTQLERAARAKIGVVLEDHGLYEHLSPLQNLDYYGRIFGLPETRRQLQMEKLLRQADLWEIKDEKAGVFSKGMKQRLALARALLHDPDLVFLDEPTSGLDPEATAAVRQLIVQLSKERHTTVFLNSHNLDEVERMCSHLAILYNGSIQVQGSIEHLREQFGNRAMEIALGEEMKPNELESLLASLPFVSECKTVDRQRLEVQLTDAACKSELLRVLASQSIPPQKVREVENSLERVYLSVIHEAKTR